MELNLILLCIFCAFLELDNLFIGQFMLSRPITAGAVTGAVFGDFLSGFILGTMAELWFLKTKPIGTYIPPNSFVCAALALILVRIYNLEVYFAFITGIIFAYIFSLADIIYRKKISYAADKLRLEIEKNADGTGKWIFRVIVSRFIFVFAFFILSSIALGNLLFFTAILPVYVRGFLFVAVFTLVFVKGTINFIRIFARKNG